MKNNTVAIKYVTHDSQTVQEIHTNLKQRFEELLVVWNALDMNFRHIKYPVDSIPPWEEFWGGSRYGSSFTEFCRDSEQMSQLVTGCNPDKICGLHSRRWSKSWKEEGMGLGKIDMQRADIPMLIYTFCVGRRLSKLPLEQALDFIELGSVPVIVDDAFFWGSGYREPRLPVGHQLRVDDNGELPIFPLAVSSPSGATYILYENMFKNISNNFLLYKLDV